MKRFPEKFSHAKQRFSDLSKEIQYGIDGNFQSFRDSCSNIRQEIIKITSRESLFCSGQHCLEIGDGYNALIGELFLTDNHERIIALSNFFSVYYFPNSTIPLNCPNFELIADTFVPTQTLAMSIAQTHTNFALKQIRAGVDVNAYNLRFGTTPLLLSIAKGWGHRETIAVREKSPDIEMQRPIIEALLNSPGINVHCRFMKNGMTPLHIACLRGDDPALITLLLEHDADPLATDDLGRTPAQLTTLSYEEAQKIITNITGEGFEAYKFGLHNATRQYAENESEVATLPTRAERDKNIDVIKNDPRFLKPRRRLSDHEIFQQYEHVHTLMLFNMAGFIDIERMNERQLKRLNATAWLIMLKLMDVKTALALSDIKVDYISTPQIASGIRAEGKAKINEALRMTDEQCSFFVSCYPASQDNKKADTEDTENSEFKAHDPSQRSLPK